LIKPAKNKLLKMNTFETSRKLILKDPTIEEETEALSSSEEAEIFDIFHDLENSLEKHDDAVEQRTSNLNNLKRLVCRLLKKGSANAETQTDGIEFLEPNIPETELRKNSSRLVP
jgi:hypothetical protein